MARYWSSLLALFVLLTPSLQAKDKKKILPAYVLEARTVSVVIDPDAGISPANPNENRIARADVEAAVLTWGRFSLVMDAQTADLVISVRRGNGKVVNRTIGGVPDGQPVMVQPSDSGIHIGAQQGKNPDTVPTAVPPPPGAHPQTEIGPAEDSFSVYRGHVEYPLDAPPVWRCVAKDALSSPAVPAVAQFRKIVEETEKQLSPKKP